MGQDFGFTNGQRETLLIDNFSGHYISYKPKNIHLEYFKPNLTMLMAEEAWDHVDQTTIKHCWEHTKIQPIVPASSPAAPNPSRSSPTAPTPVIDPPLCPHATQDKKAWDILCDFAVDDNISLPETEKRLQAYLGSRYVYTEWKGAFDVVLGAENDQMKALEGVNQLANTSITQFPAGAHLSHQIPPQSGPQPPQQMKELENDLMKVVESLKERKRIFGTALTLVESRGGE